MTCGRVEDQRAVAIGGRPVRDLAPVGQLRETDVIGHGRHLPSTDTASPTDTALSWPGIGARGSSAFGEDLAGVPDFLVDDRRHARGRESMMNRDRFRLSGSLSCRWHLKRKESP